MALKAHYLLVKVVDLRVDESYVSSLLTDAAVLFFALVTELLLEVLLFFIKSLSQLFEGL